MGRLHQLVESGNFAEIKKILQREKDKERELVNEKNAHDYDQTPLHVACSTGNLKIARLLVKKADINIQDRNGWTPLHTASYYQQLIICQMLLQIDDIDPSKLTHDRTTALHYLVRVAPKVGEVELFTQVLRLCIEKGDGINSQTKTGETALHRACQKGNKDAVQILLEKKADPNTTNSFGETALYYAVQVQPVALGMEIVQLLLQNNAHANIKNNQLKSPVDICPPEITPILTEYLKIIEPPTPASQAPDSSEPVKIYDITEFKLRVRVLRAIGLLPLSGKDSVTSFVQISYNEQKKTSKLKPSAEPKWNETFLFDVEDSSPITLKFSIFHQEGETVPSKDDLLGFLSLNLSEFDIDMSGAGTIFRNVFNLKRPKKMGATTGQQNQKPSKLRVEISFVLKSQLDENSGNTGRLTGEDDDSDNEPSPLSRSSSSSSSAITKPVVGVFGWKRGSCKTEGCDCDYYQPENVRGGPCQNCSHFPAQHENHGKDPTYELDDSTGSSLTSSSSDVGMLTSSSSSSSLSAPVSPSISRKPSATWEIDSSELKMNKRLGEGTSAVVFRGTYRSQDVAIKVLKEKAEAKVLEEFHKEFEIMSSLRSPHVVFFYGATTNSKDMCMVLEFCGKGSLFDVLNDQSEEITWPRVLKTAYDTIRGISCLHHWKPQIVHRDLKSLNLLVDENWAVKVSDFGTARFTGGDPSSLSTLTKLRGTYAYCAPEVYFGKNFTTKSDTYSYGIILWELAHRCINRVYAQPYSEYTHIVFDFQIIIQTAKNNLRPTIPATCPQVYVDLIKRCWDPEPDNRPETEELIQMVRDLQNEYSQNKEAWDSAIKLPTTV